METIIIYMAAALIISAICSVCEAALSSTPISFVSSIEGKPGATTLRKFKEEMDQPLAAILIINTIANTVGASLVGSEASLYAQAQGIPEPQVIGAVSGIFTFLVLLVAEIIPKTIGANYWRSIILMVVKVIRCMIFLTYPLVKILSFMTRKMSNEDATAISKDEITAVANEGAKDGVINKSVNNIIQKILRLDSVKAEQIMAPAPVVTSIMEDTVLKVGTTMYKRITSSKGYSRVPVKDEKGYCIGYVLKDEIIASKREEVNVKNMMHSINSYNDDTPVLVIFNKMIKNHENISAITDNFGTFRGIVTLEDVLEEMLGVEIVDETDDAIEDMQELALKQLNETIEQSN